MIQQLQDFIASHPAGFTDTDLMNGIPEAFWSRAVRELYEMALIDHTIHYDAATDQFIQRRSNG
jgi:hypothetical protein